MPNTSIKVAVCLALAVLIVPEAAVSGVGAWGAMPASAHPPRQGAAGQQARSYALTNSWKGVSRKQRFLLNDDAAAQQQQQQQPATGDGEGAATRGMEAHSWDRHPLHGSRCGRGPHRCDALS